MLKSVIFINSHPIQYFAPMYQYMNRHGVQTKVWYCSDKSIHEFRDNEFGVKIKWDIPLLDGYEYLFFKNYSCNPSHESGFFGLINLGMIRQLFREPKSIIVVHGWHYVTHLLIIMLGKMAGHTICLRNETPYKQEVLKTGRKHRIKRLVLKYILFPRIHYFMYIGIQNYLFYRSYGLKARRLVFCPYAIDNTRFKADSKQLKKFVPQIKKNIGLPAGSRVILFAAKYIEKKKPLDVLQAFMQVNIPDCWLVMVGEGELRKEMENFIAKNKLKQVILTGFVNQSHISEYYVISDLFVMCSSVGETWGLSVNEAMNFDLPVIISDLTGCSDDLVMEDHNGYTFETGNVCELANRIKDILIDNKLTGSISSESIIEKYSYTTIVDSMKHNLMS